MVKKFLRARVRRIFKEYKCALFSPTFCKFQSERVQGIQAESTYILTWLFFFRGWILSEVRKATKRKVLFKYKQCSNNCILSPLNILNILFIFPKKHFLNWEAERK